MKQNTLKIALKSVVGLGGIGRCRGTIRPTIPKHLKVSVRCSLCSQVRVEALRHLDGELYRSTGQDGGKACFPGGS